MLGFVEWHHVSSGIDADVSQRTALPPETTSPDLLVVLLLVSEIGETLPLKGSKDAFVANEVANLQERSVFAPRTRQQDLLVERARCHGSVQVMTGQVLKCEDQ